MKAKFTFKKSIFKLSLLVVISFLLSNSAIAQDIIIKIDGSEIQAKVIEIGTTEIKYTRFGSDTPVYSLLKSDIFMIKYEDGEKDVFMKEDQQDSAVALNQEIYKYTFGNPIYLEGGRKNAWGSGIASFFIPGLGQFINGDVGGGAFFLGSNIIFNSMFLFSESESVSLFGFIGSLTIQIFSTVNAAQIANRVNIARGYRIGSNNYIKIEPDLLKMTDLAEQNFHNSAYGLKFQLSF